MHCWWKEKIQTSDFLVYEAKYSSSLATFIEGDGETSLIQRHSCSGPRPSFQVLPLNTKMH